jgi:hypothetical protein
MLVVYRFMAPLKATLFPFVVLLFLHTNQVGVTFTQTGIGELLTALYISFIPHRTLRISIRCPNYYDIVLRNSALLLTHCFQTCASTFSGNVLDAESDHLLGSQLLKVILTKLVSGSPTFHSCRRPQPADETLRRRSVDIMYSSRRRWF